MEKSFGYPWENLLLSPTWKKSFQRPCCKVEPVLRYRFSPGQAGRYLFLCFAIFVLEQTSSKYN